MDIYFTSDIHSYLSERDREGGGYLLCARHFAPDSLILDGGDNLQGSPLSMYCMQEKILPSTIAFNAVGLNYYSLGNHDFNYGQEVLKKYIEEMNAVCLDCNVEASFLDIKKWAVHTASDGTRVGLTGAVTDYVNVWEKKENLEGIAILDTVQCAKKALEELKAQNCDFYVLIYHGGYEMSRTYPGTSDTIESRAYELMELGFDVVLCSHQHLRVDAFYHNGCLSLENAGHGMSYAHIKLEKGKEPTGEVLTPVEGEILRDTEKVEKELSPLYEQVDAFKATVIGSSTEPLVDDDKLKGMLYGSTLADFFNQVQCEVSGCDISITSLFNDTCTLGPTVTIGEVLEAYPFPNTLVTVEMTGEKLKKAMERSAEFFDLDEDGQITISKRVLRPKVLYYDYNFLYGVDYAYDIRRPVQDRVVKLEYRGEDLLENPQRTFTVVINNYRACGAGGYEVFATCPVKQSWQEELQEVLIDYFKQNSPVRLKDHSHFEVLC